MLLVALGLPKEALNENQKDALHQLYFYFNSDGEAHDNDATVAGHALKKRKRTQGPRSLAIESGP